MILEKCYCIKLKNRLRIKNAIQSHAICHNIEVYKKKNSFFSTLIRSDK